MKFISLLSIRLIFSLSISSCGKQEGGDPPIIGDDFFALTLIDAERPSLIVFSTLSDSVLAITSSFSLQEGINFSMSNFFSGIGTYTLDNEEDSFMVIDVSREVAVWAAKDGQE